MPDIFWRFCLLYNIRFYFSILNSITCSSPASVGLFVKRRAKSLKTSNLSFLGPRKILDIPSYMPIEMFPNYLTIQSI